MDRLAEQLGIKINRLSCKAYVGKGQIGKEKVILAKPQTFMNLSGQSVAALLHFYKTDPSHLIVIYDDSDLDEGKLRIRKAGSAGGHNGMKDIIHMIGTREFTRIRVGIGHRPEYMDMVDFVLGRPGTEERKLIETAMDRAVEAVQDIILNGVDHAMNRFN